MAKSPLRVLEVYNEHFIDEHSGHEYEFQYAILLLLREIAQQLASFREVVERR